MGKNLKILSIFVIVLTIFTGCAEDKTQLSNKEPVTLTVWHYYNGNQKDSFDRLIEEFNETYGNDRGIIIEAFSQGDINELRSKVIAAAKREVGAYEMPHIFAAYTDTAYEMNELDMLIDLKDYMTTEEIDEYIDSYMKEGDFNQDGKYKLFPIAKSTEVLMINQTVWEEFASETGADEAGLATWEGIARLAGQYYEWTDAKTPEANDGKAFFGRDAYANYMLVGSKQLGTEIFEASEDGVTLNLDRETLKRLWDCYYVPYINGYYSAIGRFRSDDVKTGDIIACICSTSGSTYFPTFVTREDGSTYDIVGKTYMLPGFEGTENYAVQQGAGMAIVRSSEKEEYAAVEFLKWFTDKSNNMNFGISAGYLPVKGESNTYDNISAAVEQAEPPISPLMKQVLLTAQKITSEYHLYTPIAFADANTCRGILDTSMQEKAQEDRNQVLLQIAQGVDRVQAVKQLDTEENFELWYQELKSELEQIIMK